MPTPGDTIPVIMEGMDTVTSDTIPDIGGIEVTAIAIPMPDGAMVPVTGVGQQPVIHTTATERCTVPGIVPLILTDSTILSDMPVRLATRRAMLPMDTAPPVPVMTMLLMLPARPPRSMSPQHTLPLMGHMDTLQWDAVAAVAAVKTDPFKAAQNRIGGSHGGRPFATTV